MSRSKFIYSGIFLLAVSFGVIFFYYLNNTVFIESSLKPLKEPCGFRAFHTPSFDWEAHSAREKRQTYGYSVEVSIEAAVKKFNEEMRCYSQYDEFPELSEDEVIASFINFDSLDNKANYTEARRAERIGIINDRILPKGSLLQFDSGSCQNVSRFSKDLCARGLKISLILNLDKKEDEKSRTKEEDILIIRKTFTKVEPRQ